MLVVFEGIDGSGKGMQVKLLLSYFKQHSIRYRLHKFPTKKAKDAFAHLEGKKEIAPLELAGIFADDILDEKEKMKRELSDGVAVVCDRYLHSTLAYQGAKGGYGAVKALVEKKGALVPDVVFLLDIEAARAAERKYAQKKPDRFESDVLFLEKVRKNYVKMEHEHFLAYKYVVVDAEKKPEEVFTEIITNVEPMIGKK
ncbi:MAG: dTMP kinase [Candidatus Anstonellaceae archaeon]